MCILLLNRTQPNLYNILCTINTQYTSRQDAIITIRLYLAYIAYIASCLDVCCVLTVRNILYKFDNTQRDDLSQKQKHDRIVIQVIPSRTEPSCCILLEVQFILPLRILQHYIYINMIYLLADPGGREV